MCLFLYMILTKWSNLRSEDEVKVLYENGWFIGEMKHFNKKFSEYMVPFIDGSEDYICITEADDLEIILL